MSITTHTRTAPRSSLLAKLLLILGIGLMALIAFLALSGGLGGTDSPPPPEDPCFIMALESETALRAAATRMSRGNLQQAQHLFNNPEAFRAWAMQRAETAGFTGVDATMHVNTVYTDPVGLVQSTIVDQTSILGSGGCWKWHFNDTQQLLDEVKALLN